MKAVSEPGNIDAKLATISLTGNGRREQSLLKAFAERYIHQFARAGIGGDHRFDLGEGRFVAAAHHRQRAVLGAGQAAGDRRVDEAEAAFLRLARQFARHVRGSGGVVDKDRAARHAGEGAVGAERHRAQIVVVADAGEDDRPAARRVARRGGRSAAVLRHPFLSPRRGAVVDDDFVAAAGFEVARHRVAHDAQSEKRDFSQCPLLVDGAGARPRGRSIARFAVRRRRALLCRRGRRPRCRARLQVGAA